MNTNSSELLIVDTPLLAVSWVCKDFLHKNKPYFPADRFARLSEACLLLYTCRKQPQI